MSRSPSRKYDPRAFKGLTFHDATTKFRDGVELRAPTWSAV